MSELRRVEIDPYADQQKLAAVCLGKAMQTSWGGAVKAHLFVPRATFDFFNVLEPREAHRKNSSGESVYFKDVQVVGVPFIKVTLHTIEAPQ